MDNITIKHAQKSDVRILTELLCELYENHPYEDMFAENKAHFGNKQNPIGKNGEPMPDDRTCIIMSPQAKLQRRQTILTVCLMKK
jgi:hypothetical protein